MRPAVTSRRAPCLSVGCRRPRATAAYRWEPSDSQTAMPGWNQGATPSWKWVLSVGNGIFSLLARLSQDSNIFRMFATDGPGIHDVSFVLVHALSFEAASRTESARR